MITLYLALLPHLLHVLLLSASLHSPSSILLSSLSLPFPFSLAIHLFFSSLPLLCPFLLVLFLPSSPPSTPSLLLLLSPLQWPNSGSPRLHALWNYFNLGPLNLSIAKFLLRLLIKVPVGVATPPTLRVVHASDHHHPSPSFLVHSLPTYSLLTKHPLSIGAPNHSLLPTSFCTDHCILPHFPASSSPPTVTDHP